MRRTLFLTTILALPGTAFAADFTLTAPVVEAEIYLQGATLLRAEAVDLPVGEHRLLIPQSDGNGLPDISVVGATVGAVEILPNAVADGRDYLTAEQQATLTAYEDAQEAEQVAEDARIRAEAAVKAAEDQLVFLRSVDAGGLEALNPEALLATLDLVGSRIQQTEIARADSRAALREAERAVREAGYDRQQAQLDFEATGANVGALSLMAIGVTVTEAGPVDLRLESFTQSAGWSTSYDVTLGADDVVTLDRKVEIYQRAGLPLHDVAVTLSTADPFAATAPREVFPNQAQLQKPQPEISGASLSRAAPRPMAEADFASTAAEPVLAAYAQANFDGPVVTYDYPEPVTLPMGGSMTLALDSQSVDARIFNRANPRTDDTAFLMAEVTNSTGEPLLPGQATIYREGSRIGETNLPLMPAGDEVELAFGPQQHLRLEFAQLENNTGDRGLFFTSGTRQQDMVFRVRNLSDEDEVVETRFALPFSEEEDLEVSVTTDPAPDARNIDDRRGVAQWDLEVAAGAEVEVEIGVTLEWPEGETLLWQP